MHLSQFQDIELPPDLSPPQYLPRPPPEMGGAHEKQESPAPPLFVRRGVQQYDQHLQPQTTQSPDRTPATSQPATQQHLQQSPGEAQQAEQLRGQGFQNGSAQRAIISTLPHFQSQYPRSPNPGEPVRLFSPSAPEASSGQNGPRRDTVTPVRQKPPDVRRPIGVPLHYPGDRIMEMVYLHDSGPDGEGYFLSSQPGLLYHYWYLMKLEDQSAQTLYGPKGLSFGLNCPKKQRLASYNHVYLSWQLLRFLDYRIEGQKDETKRACARLLDPSGAGLREDVKVRLAHAWNIRLTENPQVAAKALLWSEKELDQHPFPIGTHWFPEFKALDVADLVRKHVEPPPSATCTFAQIGRSGYPSWAYLRPDGASQGTLERANRATTTNSLHNIFLVPASEPVAKSVAKPASPLVTPQDGLLAANTEPVNINFGAWLDDDSKLYWSAEENPVPANTSQKQTWSRDDNGFDMLINVPDHLGIRT